MVVGADRTARRCRYVTVGLGANWIFVAEPSRGRECYMPALTCAA